jgi:hypothetical protein
MRELVDLGARPEATPRELEAGNADVAPCPVQVDGRDRVAVGEGR